MGFFNDFVKPSNHPDVREVEYETLPKKAKQRYQAAKDGAAAKSASAKEAANKARGKPGKCKGCGTAVAGKSTHCNPCAKKGF